MLLITTIANHGRSLGTRGGDSQSDKTEDSNLFPLSSHEGGGKKKPSPFSAPPLSSVLDLAQVLAERHNESALDGAELTRHLATVLVRAYVKFFFHFFLFVSQNLLLSSAALFCLFLLPALIFL